MPYLVIIYILVSQHSTDEVFDLIAEYVYKVHLGNYNAYSQHQGLQPLQTDPTFFEQVIRGIQCIRFP